MNHRIITDRELQKLIGAFGVLARPSPNRKDCEAFEVENLLRIIQRRSGPKSRLVKRHDA